VSRYRVEEAPRGGRNLRGQAEREAALATWARVTAADGSTVAYVPDVETAREIADARERGE
jgi:hypothetical protein